MITFGIFGLLAVSCALWVRDEVKQNIVFIIGGISLLIYSVSIDEIIFVILQAVFIISATVELAKIKKEKSTK
ncbi:MAG: hypothetical protein HY455_00190 [Parcubacteria group bacterium]|nr:hypothetical protein [Parcubacteria group bacterium]